MTWLHDILRRPFLVTFWWRLTRNGALQGVERNRVEAEWQDDRIFPQWNVG